MNPLIQLSQSECRRAPLKRGGICWQLVSACLLASPFALAQVPLPDDFDASISGVVNSLAIQPDGKIHVGGNFTTLCGQMRYYLGRLNAEGTLDGGFHPDVGGNYPYVYVYSIAVQPDGKILLGGDFTTVDWQQRNYLARLNSDGTLDSEFNPGANDKVYALAVQPDGKILVGGRFTTLGGQTRNSIGRLNSDGTIDSGFNPGATRLSRVYTLAMQANGKILAGGTFTMLGGQSRKFIGRLNADGTPDTGFNPGADWYVYSLAVQADEKILVGGELWALGGQTRHLVGRLNADGSLDTGFDVGIIGAPTASYHPYVDSLAIQADGKIFIAGYFTNIASHSRNGFARLHADGTIDTEFNPARDFSSPVAIQSDGKTLVIGPNSARIVKPQLRINRLNATEPATQNLLYDGSTITWLRGGTSPEVWRTTFDYSTNGTDWSGLGAGTRIPGGWQLSGVSLPPSARIRARGYVTGGQYNGSSWFVESQIGGPIQLNLARDGANAVLNWTGGYGPYQVQQSAELGTSNVWENVGEPLETNALSLPIGTSNLFLRVRGN